MTRTEPPVRSIPLPWLLGIAFLLSLLAGVVGWKLGLGGPGAPVGEAVSDQLTGFRLPTLDGRQIGPADMAGQVVLVDFWATWCVPCREQARILHGLYEEFRDEGVEFLAVSLGEAETTVRQFVEDKPFPYPVLVDAEDSLSIEAGIYALPTVMVIDRQGTVAYLQQGISDDETLRRVLREAVAGQSG